MAKPRSATLSSLGSGGGLGPPGWPGLGTRRRLFGGIRARAVAGSRHLLMTGSVPFNDLGRLGTDLTERLEAAALRVLRSGWYLLGPETDAFEAEFAGLCGSAGCVGVGNGTDALEIALRAVGCTAGDDVVVVANAGMYATTACLAIGARPVFADVDPATLLATPSTVGAAVTDRTVAVVATHLYGAVVDVPALRAVLPAGIRVVEDGAQAHGASIDGTQVGSMGDAAAFSFYPTKNLGALGDGGAVTSSDDTVLARARALRQYGWEERYVATVPGGRNSRMDEIQVALLLELIPGLTERNEARRGIRERYAAGLSEVVAFVERPQRADVVDHLCVVRSPDRDRLVDVLASDGIQCGVHYPVPDHLQPVLSGADFGKGDLRETERACDEVLSLPCFPGLRDDEVERVIDAVERNA